MDVTPAGTSSGGTGSAGGVVSAVWRIEAARVVGALARATRDIALAEDLAQDALVAALEQWPQSGVPDSPGAWLLAVAKRRWIDGVRRDVAYQRKLGELGRETTWSEDPMDDLDVDGSLTDDVLRLVFTACHPVLRPDARVALTLRMVAGLTTEEIARAFLVPTPTMAQRITRAKKALGDAHVPFEIPVGSELHARLGSVLEVVYLVFNEGYTATSGAAWTRPVLCEEGTRLARMLAALAPGQPEVLGLVALLEIQASRLRARIAPDGSPVTLLEQDRTAWDRLLITHALGCLDQARAQLTATGERPGSYLLQAEIAACHARAAAPADTDWDRIAALYASLAALTGSPVVELNRAVAVAMADGPAAGLDIVDGLAGSPALARYHLLPAVRGDLLARLGRDEEARAEFLRAADLTDNDRERHLLRQRAGTFW